MKFRIYIDDFKKNPFIWSIDEGDIRTEVNVKSIAAENVALSVGSDLSADNINSPKAWIEVEAEALYIDESGRAYFINSAVGG